ncbi:hypothetical protein LTR49_028037, partial [Elasticomyces elasticus]
MLAGVRGSHVTAATAVQKPDGQFVHNGVDSGSCSPSGDQSHHRNSGAGTCDHCGEDDELPLLSGRRRAPWSGNRTAPIETQHSAVSFRWASSASNGTVGQDVIEVCTLKTMNNGRVDASVSFVSVSASGSEGNANTVVLLGFDGLRPRSSAETKAAFRGERSFLMPKHKRNPRTARAVAGTRPLRQLEEMGAARQDSPTVGTG